MSVQLDLEFHYGENWIIQYECNDGNGNDINLTGAISGMGHGHAQWLAHHDP